MSDSRPSQESPRTDPFEMWRQVYEANEQAWTKATREILTSQSYAEAQGKMLESFLSLQKMMRDGMTTQLNNLNLPTRDDVARLGELILSLEEKIDRIEDRLIAVEERLDRLSRGTEKMDRIPDRLASLEDRLGEMARGGTEPAQERPARAPAGRARPAPEAAEAAAGEKTK